MKRYFSLYLLLCLFLFSESSLRAQSLSIGGYLQQEGVQATPSPDGIYFLSENEGRGRAPSAGDYVMVNYVGKLLDGTVFDQSDSADPFVFQLGYRQVIKGWESGIPLMKVGSKGKLLIPSELAYGKRGAGKVVPANAPLLFEIELLRIMNFEEYDQYMIDLEKKERVAYEQHVKDQFKIDKKLIQEYALQHKMKAKRTKSGLSYVITKKGKGDLARPGDILSVHYEGQLTDGTVFDASKKPYEVHLGRGKVIDGWEEGLQFFKRGAEGWLLIPSQMAYGPRAIEEDGLSIPGDAILVFKIKVESIKKGELTGSR